MRRQGHFRPWRHRSRRFESDRYSAAKRAGTVSKFITFIVLLGFLVVAARLPAGPLDGLFRSKDAGTYERRMSQWHYRGSYRKAVENGRTAAKLGANTYWFYMRWGSSCRHSGRWAEASNAFERALKVTPEGATQRGRLGLAYLGEGRLGEAQSVLEEAREVWDKLFEAHYGLGWIHCERGRYAEALVCFDDSIRCFDESSVFGLRSGYVKVYFGAGYASRQLGQLDRAVAYFLWALRLEPERSETRYHLGLTYLAMGDRGAALGEFEVLKRLDAQLAGDLLQQIREAE